MKKNFSGIIGCQRHLLFYSFVLRTSFFLSNFIIYYFQNKKDIQKFQTQLFFLTFEIRMRVLI